MERSNGPNITVEEICNKDCYSGIQSIEFTQSYRKNLERFSLRRLVVLYVLYTQKEFGQLHYVVCVRIAYWS